MTAGVMWLTIMDLIGSVIYFLDLWMGFQLGIIARWEGRVVIVQSEPLLACCCCAACRWCCCAPMY